MKKTYAFLLCVWSSVFSWGQYTNTYTATLTDSVNAFAYLRQDTLLISLYTSNSKVQMSFLMQGMTIDVLHSSQKSILSVVLPSADMVRKQLRHHPNEVKAMHKSEGGEVRPDLFPLVAALNKVPAQMIAGDSTIGQCRHLIRLDKERDCLSFSVYIPTHGLPLTSDSLIQTSDSLILTITSSLKPSFLRAEYDGLQLSKEKRLPPNGLGYAPIKSNMREREIRMTKRIKPDRYRRLDRTI